MAKYNIFFGTYSKGDGNGLFRGEFDGDSGEILLKDTIDIENPSYMQFNKSYVQFNKSYVQSKDFNYNILYGVAELGSFEGENGGALFSVDLSDPAKMRLIDIKPTHGKHPCHLCVTDNMAFAANYSEGSLSIFEIDESGNIKPSHQSIHHFGKGTNPGRQRQSHIHFASMLPHISYLTVCDLGLDKVFLYPYSRESVLSTNAKIINCPPGAGPRHLDLSKDGKCLYILTELTNTVLVYKNYSGGNAQLVQEISTLPADFADKSTCAAIHVSPYGKYLGASNRGHDSIAIFKIQDNGELAFLNHIMTGKEPRDFRFSPDGKYVLSANQNGDSVTVYKIKNETFTQTSSVSLPKPVCILFGEEIK
jgi:6-phosphogluconolactonase